MSCRCLHNRACASLDLPSHGKQLLPGEPPGGISGWRWRTDRGLDFVNESQRRIDDLIDYLGVRRLAQTQGIAIAGISRGGFLAAQYAARAPPERVAAAVGGRAACTRPRSSRM